MHRTVVAAAAAVAAVAVVGWPGTPRAAADNPVCTSTWCSFLSPSRNIGCEIDYQRGSGIPDETYCQTDSPPQSVRLSTDGSFKTCTGETCLGNSGEGTPTLAYGQAAGVGPFNCRSETGGITCTAGSGRGFTLSSGGIASVG
ncbi:hypothetical protein BN971_02222 [Mycobacterium bohemicum DSM 44277]|uniref:Uncharacterized protein n=2 Tax=Mycobacterium bohemicum TaxID=56425 RepID=A0A1X1QVR5_MYCBE|nr:hypothetical protein [Mycobacterium bohemicum]MCV6969851.1 hypothetical protein [Mycobacterium bohemicum]ORU95470.1 hypothetical protein AWB93_24105 [Mycobacterium bohemicum]CPR10947.1 hypothetical protein BN971_02222 [Mycobacterium bohemicum DSM 44277]